MGLVVDWTWQKMEFMNLMPDGMEFTQCEKEREISSNNNNKNKLAQPPESLSQ